MSDDIGSANPNPYEPSGQNVPGPSAESIVSAPAIALLVAGIMNVLGAIYGIFNGVMMFVMGDQLLEQNPAFQDLQEMPDGPDPAAFQSMMGGMGAVYLAGGVLGLIVAGLIVFGALKMKKLQSYNLALAASILAMIPGLSCCCIVGLPIGIWSTMTLLKPEVKSAFH